MRFAANSPDGSQLLPSCKRGKDGRQTGSPGPAGWERVGERLQCSNQASWASLLTITKVKVTFKGAESSAVAV
ncbi:hypothetical protein PBY51_009941 [Eleginops maclovinus]|uniref:Uncharacterized protein n=1 Tax=Eleginops maclovinus TaxID=56733 RepID=A0AAN7XY04_ELEMC|nr:hypothetical protein PBY51_009941 [Eleginops maclovinus]